MEKFLLFTTGGGSADPLNWSNDEAALYSLKEFKGMKPASSRSVDMFFETSFGKEVVTLGIKNMTHTKVMKSVTQALSTNQAVVVVADVDNAIYCSPFIQTVQIASQETFHQKLTDSTKTKINVARSNYSSCLITNTDVSASVNTSLWLTSQLGSDITSTSVYAAETEAASTSSVTLTVDDGSGSASIASDNLFLNERVYKSDGTFFGVCTAVNSTTEIVFAGGLESAITNNDVLYTGTRYTLLNKTQIPFYATIKLEQDEISFDNSKFDLYATSGDSDGQITLSFIY